MIEKKVFINLKALKCRLGKYKGNDEMINPKESKPVHTEKILCSFTFLVLRTFLWKDHLPHAKVNGNGFFFGKVVPRETRLLTVHRIPVQWNSRSLNSMKESCIFNTINLMGVVIISCRQFKNWVAWGKMCRFWRYTLGLNFGSATNYITFRKSDFNVSIIG